MSTAERSTSPIERTQRDVHEDDLLTVPDELIVAMMITDPAQVRKLKARREQSPSAPRDEVWNGVYIMSPMAGFDHQRFVTRLAMAFGAVVDLDGGAEVLAGLNVSDRVDKWRENYRIPDVAVHLPGNPAIIREAFACGGPDFAVEVLSEGDLARRKLDFYAKVNTRELLLLDRDPWSLELYRLTEGRLALVGVSTPEKPDILTSEVLPLTFRLVPGEGRPTLELSRVDGGQTWRI
jgi:Uma2 family endonuclease